MPIEIISALAVLGGVVLVLGAFVGVFFLGRDHLVPRVEALEADREREAARADKAEAALEAHGAKDTERQDGARTDAGRMVDRANAADAYGVLDAAYGPKPPASQPGPKGKPIGFGRDDAPE